MSKEKFWISVWKIVATVICVFVISGVTSCQMTNQKVVRMVEAGADPMEAACSLSEGNSICHGIIAAGK